MTTTPAATGGLTPIETEYAGYKFRSRLEARWAYYFDLCGIRWAYEQEGFTLSDGQRYLPDFWLPYYNQFVEVKPACDAITFYDAPIPTPNLNDIDEVSNNIINREESLIVVIDDKWTPLHMGTVSAILALQPHCKNTVIFLEPDHSDCTTYLDEIDVLTMRGIKWKNPTRIVSRAEYAKFCRASEARHHGGKHMVALADAQDVDVGFRIVFGDPREKLQVSNRQTRELPFNEVAATAARQHRFEGARK